MKILQRLIGRPVSVAVQKKEDPSPTPLVRQTTTTTNLRTIQPVERLRDYLEELRQEYLNRSEGEAHRRQILDLVERLLQKAAQEGMNLLPVATLSGTVWYAEVHRGPAGVALMWVWGGLSRAVTVFGERIIVPFPNAGDIVWWQPNE
jgi:hypothetical protein